MARQDLGIRRALRKPDVVRRECERRHVVESGAELCQCESGKSDPRSRNAARGGRPGRVRDQRRGRDLARQSARSEQSPAVAGFPAAERAGPRVDRGRVEGLSLPEQLEASHDPGTTSRSGWTRIRLPIRDSDPDGMPALTADLAGTTRTRRPTPSWGVTARRAARFMPPEKYVSKPARGCG